MYSSRSSRALAGGLPWKRARTPLSPKGRVLPALGALGPAEATLRDACRLGDIAPVGTSLPMSKTPEGTVRAEVIRFFALGGDDSAPVHEHGVQVHGAWIEGVLDLTGCKVANLSFVDCVFEAAPDLGSAYCKALNFNGSRLPGLKAEWVRVSSSLSLCGTITTDEIRILGARVQGDFACDNARFTARFTGADKGKGNALTCDSAVVKGSVLLRKSETVGKIRFLGTKIGGNLECSGASITGAHDGKGDAMWCDGMVLKGDVLLRDINAKGEVRLLGSNIGGNLECDKGKFTGAENGNGDALTCDRAVVKGDVYLRDEFEAKGEVRLLGIEVGGNVECVKARFTCAKDSEGDALSFDGATIKGNVLLEKMFEAKGNVRLLNARIHGKLRCVNATFTHANRGKGNALSCQGAHVYDAFLIDKTTVRGTVSLDSMTVFRLVDGNCDSWKDATLILDGFDYQALAEGSVTGAEERLSWLRQQPKEHLDKRDFRPQPWVHLIRVLRSSGHDRDARRVAIAFERLKRKCDRVGGVSWFGRRAARVLHFLYGILAGYGYLPLRTVAWMVAMWILSAVFYYYAAQEGVFAPTNPLVFQHRDYWYECRKARGEGGAQLLSWYGCGALADEYTTFSPLAYSLDLILPLVDLQQERDWAPVIPAPQVVPREMLSVRTRLSLAWEDFSRVSLNHRVRLWIWFEILFGWVGSLLLVAVLSGLVKQDKDP